MKPVQYEFPGANLAICPTCGVSFFLGKDTKLALSQHEARNPDQHGAKP